MSMSWNASYWHNTHVTHAQLSPPVLRNRNHALMHLNLYCRAQCANLDACLERLSSKGVRHVVLVLDPCRKCKAAPSALATAAPVDPPPAVVTGDRHWMGSVCCAGVLPPITAHHAHCSGAAGYKHVPHSQAAVSVGAPLACYF